MECGWIDPPPANETLVARLAGDLRLPAAIARVVVRRGFADAAEAFLNPRLRDLTPPERLPRAAEAAARLDAALRSGSRISLYGDYDVDGVSSVALLSRLLSRLGGKVSCFLPSRGSEGYGISEAGAERCVATQSPELIVAVDCGTNSRFEIERLRARGIEVIVLDHHEPVPGRLAPGLVVNPKLGSEFGYLCAAGVVFKVAHALLKIRPGHGIDLREYLDFVALATVADIVPLVGENRILVRHGLRRIARSRWPGIRELARICAVEGTPRGSDVGFRLGPRINATGRLGTALESLCLLTTDEPSEAARLAHSLDAQNRERQAVERTVCAEAEEFVRREFVADRDRTIVAGARSWHQGVLGIVASRLMRRHHRPAVVVGFSEDGEGKGSGRSIAGLSLVEALGRCSALLQAFGGHEQAAGLSLMERDFGAFREAFERAVRESAPREIFVPTLGIDAELRLSDIDEDFLDAQESLDPFGCGNEQPVFRLSGITPLAEPRVVKEKHVRFDLREGRSRLGAIFFGGAGHPLPPPPWDLAIRVERNTFRGVTTPQIHVVAIRAAA